MIEKSQLFITSQQLVSKRNRISKTNTWTMELNLNSVTCTSEVDEHAVW